MVCSKCLKLSKGTTLATPAVKKKSEMYHGSPASSSSKSATLGQTGVGKVSYIPRCSYQIRTYLFVPLPFLTLKCHSEQAPLQECKEPVCTVRKVSCSTSAKQAKHTDRWLTMASSSCTKCKTKISQGHTYCNKCAYKDDRMQLSFLNLINHHHRRRHHHHHHPRINGRNAG
jgi:cysteine-rich PDZ-binding protein